VGRDSFIYGTYYMGCWLIHIRDITCGTWLIHIRDKTRGFTHALLPAIAVDVGHDLFMSGTWRAHNALPVIDVGCDSFITRHDSSIFATWLSHDALPAIDLGRDSFIHGTWLIYIRDMTPTRRLACNWRGTWLVHARDMTHPYSWHDSHTTPCL